MKYLKSNNFQLAKKIKKPTGKGIFITSFTGSGEAESPCCYARVLIKADDRLSVYPKIRETVAAFKENHCDDPTGRFYGCSPVCKGIGKSLEISCHSTPQMSEAVPGVNAIYILIQLLDHIAFTGEDIKEFLDFFNEHISFNSLLTAFQIEWTPELIMLYTSINSSGDIDSEAFYTSMLPILNKYGIGIIFDNLKRI